MNPSNPAMLQRATLRSLPYLVLALGALGLASDPAQAAALEPITVSARLLPDPGALAIPGGGAHAARLKPITLYGPAVFARAAKTVGYGAATDAPIEEMTVKARVRYNPVILTTYSGVDLLKREVAHAAREACHAIRFQHGDETCVRHAIRSAQPQLSAALTRARRTEMG